MDDDWTEDTFTTRVLELVDSIPTGHVLSYGDVAALLGSRGARAVGGVLHRHGHGHAWWRVVRAGGIPPRGHEIRARMHYDDEGTPLSVIAEAPGYRVHYAEARWNPIRSSAEVTRSTTDPENDSWPDGSSLSR